MFNMIGIGERAGSGVPDIYAVWEAQGWKAPEAKTGRKTGGIRNNNRRYLSASALFSLLFPRYALFIKELTGKGRIHCVSVCCRRSAGRGIFHPAGGPLCAGDPGRAGKSREAAGRNRIAGAESQITGPFDRQNRTNRDKKRFLEGVFCFFPVCVTKFLEVYEHISYTEAREKVRTSGRKPRNMKNPQGREHNRRKREGARKKKNK